MSHFMDNTCFCFSISTHETKKQLMKSSNLDSFVSWCVYCVCDLEQQGVSMMRQLIFIWWLIHVVVIEMDSQHSTLITTTITNTNKTMTHRFSQYFRFVSCCSHKRTGHHCTTQLEMDTWTLLNFCVRMELISTSRIVYVTFVHVSFLYTIHFYVCNNFVFSCCSVTYYQCLI